VGRIELPGSVRTTDLQSALAPYETTPAQRQGFVYAHFSSVPVSNQGTPQ